MRHVLPGICLALFAGVSVAEDTAGLEDALASSFGGATETAEEPSFGDPELLEPEFQSWAQRVADSLHPRGSARDARRVVIAVLWGYPRPHRDATEVVDWSGSLRTGNAALRVLATLRFEDTDVVVRPRGDAATVAFESRTTTDADGLLLEVVVPPTLDPREPVTLTFASRPYTATIAIEPGECLADVTEVDDAGHVVAYRIIRPDADGCTEGFMEGIWRASSSSSGRELGELKGLFTADDGRIRGHLRGVFGERENGKRVWFAKLVGEDGGFLGIFAGRYADGRFAGLLLGRRHEVRGRVHGRYRDDGGDGGFFAVYRRCRKDPHASETLDDDEPEVALDDDDC